MFEFIANNAYIFWILVCIFLYLYFVGGDDIIFFRKKKHAVDPKSAEKINSELAKFARSRDCVVMGPATIEFEDKKFSYDALLLSYAGTYVIAKQPEIGEVYAELTTAEWPIKWNGQRNTVANPLDAMKDGEKLLRELYRAEGCKYGTTNSIVVFTNKNANVVAQRNVPVCHVVDLGKKLADMKATADNGAAIEAMKAAIEKYSK